MTSKKKAIWMSYDFGLRGNYSSLFTFLDNHDAKDCGNGLAYFEYENPEEVQSEELIENLKRELFETVSPLPSDRIYVIWKDDSGGTVQKVKGKFLFGKRRSTPWNGYGTKSENKISDEAI